MTGFLLDTNIPSGLARPQSDLAIVTRNVRNFEGLGVSVFNPWSMQ